MADDHHRTTVKTRDTADNRFIVSEGAVTGQFVKFVERQADIIQGVRTARVARQLRNLPCTEIGVGDKVNMLQYSTYSVISPEGCASILWKSADKAPLAAEAMGIIAPRLKELKLIDSIVPEPLGGAHRNPEAMAASLKAQLLADLADLDLLSEEELLNRRYQRLMSYGYA